MLTHRGTQTIETQRLILRRFSVDDAATMYHNWASDDEVTKYLTWPSHGSVETTEAVLREWVASYNDEAFYLWAIELAGQPIGSISVVERNDDLKNAEIGYCMGRRWWYRGIMSETLKAVMDYLFDEVGYRRLEARHDPRNPNSGAVMRKCGMKYEGTTRGSDRNNQGICDASYYALLRDER